MVSRHEGIVRVRAWALINIVNRQVRTLSGLRSYFSDPERAMPLDTVKAVLAQFAPYFLPDGSVDRPRAAFDLLESGGGAILGVGMRAVVFDALIADVPAFLRWHFPLYAWADRLTRTGDALALGPWLASVADADAYPFAFRWAAAHPFFQNREFRGGRIDAHDFETREGCTGLPAKLANAGLLDAWRTYTDDARDVPACIAEFHAQLPVAAPPSPSAPQWIRIITHGVPTSILSGEQLILSITDALLLHNALRRMKAGFTGIIPNVHRVLGSTVTARLVHAGILIVGAGNVGVFNRDRIAQMRIFIPLHPDMDVGETPRVKPLAEPRRTTVARPWDAILMRACNRAARRAGTHGITMPVISDAVAPDELPVLEDRVTALIRLTFVEATALHVLLADAQNDVLPNAPEGDPDERLLNDLAVEGYVIATDDGAAAGLRIVRDRFATATFAILSARDNECGLWNRIAALASQLARGPWEHRFRQAYGRAQQRRAAARPSSPSRFTMITRRFSLRAREAEMILALVERSPCTTADLDRILSGELRNDLIVAGFLSTAGTINSLRFASTAFSVIPDGDIEQRTSCLPHSERHAAPVSQWHHDLRAALAAHAAR